jgi:hypothetical protein
MGTDEYNSGEDLRGTNVAPSERCTNMVESINTLPIDHKADIPHFIEYAKPPLRADGDIKTESDNDDDATAKRPRLNGDEQAE